MAHRAEILGVLVRLKEFFNPSFYAVGDVFELFLIGLFLIFNHRKLLSKKLAALNRSLRLLCKSFVL